MASSTTLLVLLLITLIGHAIAQNAPGPPHTGPPSIGPIIITVHDDAQTAPAPSSTGPINITAILVKGGPFSTFIHLLTSTQAGDQINTQVNNSQDGMTVFAPTDSAFMNLPTGYMNNLSNNQQVQLVQYHVLPKHYTLSDFLTVSNPVRTQASGQDGRLFGLYFSGVGNQVNVSSRLVETQLNNALRQESPLAVYQIDKVLLPKEFTEAKAPSPSPVTEKAAPADSSTGPKAKSSPVGSTPSGSGRLDIGLGLVAGVGLFCIGLLF